MLGIMKKNDIYVVDDNDVMMILVMIMIKIKSDI